MGEDSERAFLLSFIINIFAAAAAAAAAAAFSYCSTSSNTNCNNTRKV